MTDFVKIIEKVFNQKFKQKHQIVVRSKDIVEVNFSKFGIVLYYSAKEFDLGLNYCSNKQEKSLEQILLELGCREERFPTYKFMTDERIMINYLNEYADLINQYFDGLSKIGQ